MKNDLFFKNFIIEEYNIYKKYNYYRLNDYCFSYGIDPELYKKDITNISKLVLNNLISKLKITQAKYSYKEFNNFFKINILFHQINTASNPININIPAFIENIGSTCDIILKYILENKINSKISIAKMYTNSSIIITMYDISEAKKTITFFNSNRDFLIEKKSRQIPLFHIIDDFSISSDIDSYNYIPFFNYLLTKVFNSINSQKDLTIDYIVNFIENLKNTEKNIIKKEMINIILKSVKIISNKNDAFGIFDYDSNMKISSFNHSDYRLLLNENNLLYFKLKDTESIVSFGSEEYLDLTYSKFYLNFIEKSSNLTYYTYFKKIFYTMLENRFENYCEMLDFTKLDLDKIYQQVVVISACYFAYKKLGIEYNTIYEIIKYVFEKKYNIIVDIEFEKKTRLFQDKIYFPFNIEYGNRIITLKNGIKTTLIDYYQKNGIFNVIKLDSKVKIKKSGEILLGKEFLIRYTSFFKNYNDFNELVADIVEEIVF